MRVCVLLEDKDDFLFQIYSKPIFQTKKFLENLALLDQAKFASDVKFFYIKIFYFN